MELLKDNVVFRKEPHCKFIATPTVKSGSVPREAGSNQGAGLCIQCSVFFTVQKQSPRRSSSAEEKECHPHSYEEVLKLPAILLFTGLPPLYSPLNKLRFSLCFTQELQLPKDKELIL